MADIYTFTLSDGVTTFTVYPLESNGPGNVSIPRQIQVTNVGASFELVGDLTYRFVAGQTFTVINSGAGSPSLSNDGTYTVAGGGSTYSAGTNRTTIPVVETGQIVTSGLPLGQIQYSIPSAEEATSLLIPGRGYVNYGLSVLENTVHMLENFASDTPPSNPLIGQMWYDTATETFNKWTGSAWTSDSGVGTGSLVLNDPQNPNGVGSPVVANIYVTGSEASLPAPWAAGSPTNNQPGLVVWGQVDPNSGDAIFRVLSSDGTERLRVEHDGLVSTANSFKQTGTTLDNDFASDIQFANAKGIKGVGGAFFRTDTNGEGWVLQGSNAATATLLIKDTAGTSNLFAINASNNVEILNNLIVDTNTLYVDAASNRVGVNKVPTVAFDVSGIAQFDNNLVVDTNTLYVDATLNVIGIGAVPSAGSALQVNGDIDATAVNLAADPTAPLEAATKQYVDSINVVNYDYQAGTGAGAGSPLTSENYTTSFNFTVPAGSPPGTATVMVFVNGVKQIEGADKAYTLTAPNTVTFNAGAAPQLNDDVEFYGFG